MNENNQAIWSHWTPDKTTKLHIYSKTKNKKTLKYLCNEPSSKENVQVSVIVPLIDCTSMKLRFLSGWLAAQLGPML